jgi:alpha-1,2-mannosyltransferase
MVPSIGWAASGLRDCGWLDAERARACKRILLAITALGCIGWIALGADGLDREGKPIGTDFVGFYSASRLALDGRPYLAYDVGAHWAAEKALFGPALGYTAFFYPPPALMICLPLALAPYFWSLATWLAATGYAYYRVLRLYLPSLDPAALLAFPAVFVNAAHGQNGFLSAALIGGGLFAMDRRPALAGVLFGAMAFKPHLALAIPFALVFARRWTSFAVAAAAAAAFSALSLAAFGRAAWDGFFADAWFARSALENHLVGDEKMQSVFAAVRLLHGGLTLAYGLQAAATLAVCAALVALQFRAFRSKVEGPAMIAAALLASPFLLDYDLVLLAFPLACLVREGLRVGFRPYEKIILVAAFILPAVSRSIAGHLGLPLGPIVTAAVLMLVMRRAGESAPLRARVGADLRNAQGALSPAAQTMIEIA